MIYPWHAGIWQTTFSQGRLPASLLVTARPGIGEDDFCRHVVQALLCRRHTTGDACEVCEDCTAYNAGTHPNYREVLPQALAQQDSDAAEPVGDASGQKSKRPSNQIRVDDIRALDDFLHLTPHGEGAARVIWIHPADSLNTAAANALLKVLEEPPSYTHFLLLTHQPAKLLPTILSRCVHLDLPRPSTDDALKWLQQQGTANAPLALALSGQSPGRAMAMSPHEWQLRNQVLRAMGVRERDDTSSGADARIDDEDVANVLHIIQTWCWDLLGYKLSRKVRYHVDKAQEISHTVEHLALPDLLDFERYLRSARRLVEHPLNARLFVDDLLLRYARMTSRPS